MEEQVNVLLKKKNLEVMKTFRFNDSIKKLPANQAGSCLKEAKEEEKKMN